MAGVISTKTVKTRKPHACWGCGIVQPSGVMMETIIGHNGDGFYKGYWCAVCREYWRKHMRDDDEIAWGELRENDPEEWELCRKELETQS